MDNIYLKKNDDWTNKLKYGYVYGNKDKLIQRLNDSREEHSEKSEFIKIFTFNKNNNYCLVYKEIDKIFSLFLNWKKNTENILELEKIYNTKFPFLREVQKYLIISKTRESNEFINVCGLNLFEQILKKEFALIGLEMVKEYSDQEIKEINDSKLPSDSMLGLSGNQLFLQKNNIFQWYEREYQTKIINYILEQLKIKFKIYLELATGGGKSYIIYRVLSKLNPDVVIIFSPRKNINKQNTSIKYLSILNNNYSVFNCSEDLNFEKFYNKCYQNNKKIIIVACPQKSHEKVYHLILKYELKNIFIWFDEAHHTIENWIDKIKNDKISFFLENKDIILNRLYTSASPYKNLVFKYPNIFGELYTEIKVRDLIKLKWLCEIKPFVFKVDRNVNICNYNLSNFLKLNCNFGFSFHNLRDSACNLFLKHYNIFKLKKTDIRPYLLLGDDYENELLNSIELNYDFKSIKSFEINKKSIAYVVQKYSMGYDFKSIDYTIFSDPKLSFSDIIQCIGRGLRPDGNGEHGTNLEKILNLMLPVFVDDKNDTSFDTIIKVLIYLVTEMDFEFNKIKIKDNVEVDT